MNPLDTPRGHDLNPYCLLLRLTFSKIFLHKHNQSVKQFESRSGLTFRRVDVGLNCLKGYQQITKSPLARKELNVK